MPNRVNPTAVALLAGGASASAVLLLVYLKLRAKSPDKSTAALEDSQQQIASSEDIIVPEKSQIDFEFEKVKVNDTTCVAPLLSSREGSETEEASLSECEHQLEETEEEQYSAPEEEEEVVVATVASAQESTQEMSSSVIEERQAAANNNNNNNNNNDDDDTLEVSESTLTVDCCPTVMTAIPAAVAAAAAAAVPPVGGGRVSHWLAKNERYSRQHQQSQAEHQQPHCEDASDDSGRPSSVDTAADAASPRGASSRQQKQQQQQDQQKQQKRLHPSGSAAVAAAAAASLSPLLSSSGGSDNGLLLPDRSMVIRGVSPVPGDDNDIIHQFLIPNKLGGSMVGTRGRNINYIRAKSGASVWISRNFFDKKTQVVNVRGPVECVKAALQVIKKRFPELDVKPINTAVPIQRNPALQPTMCQLSLPVGALVDVNVCAMCRGTTVFLQQPTHPSFHHLEKMDYTIMKHYVDQGSVPPLPRPVNPGAVCVAPFGTAWYRAIIADVYPEEDLVLMKYLDWGGYERMPVGCLKQIRTEMMHLPFQAVEGHLAYVSPVLSSEEDPEIQLEQLSKTLHERYLSGAGRRIKCQVVYYNDVGQPCVYLYTKDAQPDATWRFLQEELVQEGLVEWFQMPHPAPQMPQA